MADWLGSLCSWLGSPLLLGDRSPRWPAVRAAHLRQHPACEACGCRSNLEVHHVVPYHMDRTLELDPANLLTLCRTDHLVFGHCGDWAVANPCVRNDTAWWRARVQEVRRMEGLP